MKKDQTSSNSVFRDQLLVSFAKKREQQVDQPQVDEDREVPDANDEIMSFKKETENQIKEKNDCKSCNGCKSQGKI